MLSPKVSPTQRSFHSAERSHLGSILASLPLPIWGVILSLFSTCSPKEVLTGSPTTYILDDSQIQSCPWDPSHQLLFQSVIYQMLRLLPPDVFGICLLLPVTRPCSSCTGPSSALGSTPTPPFLSAQVPPLPLGITLEFSLHKTRYHSPAQSFNISLLTMACCPTSAAQETRCFSTGPNQCPASSTAFSSHLFNKYLQRPYYVLGFMDTTMDKKYTWGLTSSKM